MTAFARRRTLADRAFNRLKRSYNFNKVFLTYDLFIKCVNKNTENAEIGMLYAKDLDAWRESADDWFVDRLTLISAETGLF